MNNFDNYILINSQNIHAKPVINQTPAHPALTPSVWVGFFLMFSSMRVRVCVCH